MATEAPARAAGDKKMTEKPREQRLADIRGRVKDVFQSLGEEIETGANVRYTALVFDEMKFLLDEIDRRDKALKKLKAPLTDDE